MVYHGIEREIFRAGGLVVRGLDAGRARFVTIAPAAHLEANELQSLVEALRKHAVSSGVDDHLERLARLSTAAVG